MLAVLVVVLAAPGSAAASTVDATAPIGRADAIGEAPADRWVWPVGPPVLVIEPFRAPPTPYSAGHRGIDLTAAPGGTVVATAPGVVSFAGPVAGRGVLSIDHGDGVVSSIEPVDAAVAAGDAVRAGEPVATVATGGHCDGECIHLGVRVHGEYVSPLRWFGGVPRAVLLPMTG
ncbi:peptidoglycan DD-metalloendopeptidase family protein [Agromyces bracchium]|uniref:Peptidoglycan DD-metalloendopeptidase family protein n=2 Tax=Agromyces bracchium TaxID=88376 RepID=A0A6I3MAP2_9MICO|nr:peptidoglycan DD-metalloendopeptidase family protein [Agromyces bracchium]